MTEVELDKLQAVVARHIPRAWRGDIHVESIDRLQVANGRPAGTVFVRISSRSKLGKAQAMLSIGPYVGNEPDEWSNGWTRENGRWIFVAYEPSADPQKPSILDQEGPSASASN